MRERLITMVILVALGATALSPDGAVTMPALRIDTLDRIAAVAFWIGVPVLAALLVPLLARGSPFRRRDDPRTAAWDGDRPDAPSRAPPSLDLTDQRRPPPSRRGRP